MLDGEQREFGKHNIFFALSVQRFKLCIKRFERAPHNKVAPIYHKSVCPSDGLFTVNLAAAAGGERGGGR